MKKTSAVLLAACVHAHAVPPPSNTSAAATPPSVALILVIDRSGSMQGTKLDDARASIEAARAALPADGELGVIAFDSAPEVLLAPVRVSDKDAVAGAIARLDAGGGTQYVGALQAAERMVASVAAGKRLVIFVSDGEAAYDGVIAAVQAIAADHATVSSVGLGGDADPQLLGQIADTGGGRFYGTPDPDALPQVIANEVATFLR